MRRSTPRRFGRRLELLEDRSVPNVTAATWSSPSSYEYRIVDVPDIDQRRSAGALTTGLPNDGKMYCIPTAAMNWMAYIADHGYPTLAPGEANWQLPQNYEPMTDALLGMGVAMNTDPEDGTTGGGKLGMQVWLGSMPGLFTVSRVRARDVAWVPGSMVDHLMVPAAVGGSLILPVVGWYRPLSQVWLEETGDPLPSFIQDTLSRTGGHGFSLVGAKHTGSSRSILIHDPARPNDFLQMSQSLFTDDNHSVGNAAASFDYQTLTLGKMSGYTNGFIDAYYAIKPVLGLVAEQNQIILHLPKSILSTEPVTKTFLSAAGGKVLDLFQHPVREAHPYLVEGSSAVWQLDTLTGRSTRLATLETPKRVLVGGRALNTYVLEENRLVCLNGRGVVEARVPLSRALDAIAFDEASQRLIGISMATRELYFFGADLRPMGKADLPALPGEPAEGRVTLAVDPRDGAVWVHRDGLPQVARLHFGGRGGWDADVVTLQGARGPLGLAVDDGGHLFVSEGGVYAEYDPTGRPVEGSLFAGTPAGGIVQVARSFDTADPAEDNAPGNFNVLPEDSRQTRPDFATVLQQRDTLVILGGDADNRVSIVDRGPDGVHVDVDGYQQTFHGVRRVVVATGRGDDTVEYKRGAPGPGVATLDVRTGEGNDSCPILFGHLEEGGEPLRLAGPVSVSLDLGDGSNSAAVTFANVAVADGVTQKVVGGDQDDSVMLRSHHVTAIMKESVSTGFGNDVMIQDSEDFDGSLSLTVAAGEGDDVVSLRSRGGKGSVGVSVNLGAGDDVLVQDEENRQGTLTQKVHGEGGHDSLFERVGFNPQPDPPGVPGFTRTSIWVGGPGDDSVTVDVTGTTGPADSVSWKIAGDAGDDTAVVNVTNAVVAGKWEFAVLAGAGDDSSAVEIHEVNITGSVEVQLDAGGGDDSGAVMISDSEIIGSFKWYTDAGIGNDFVNLETTNVLIDGQVSVSQKLAAGNDVMGWSNRDVTVNGSLVADVQGGLGIDVMSVLLQPLVNAGGLYQLRLAGQDGNDRIEARIEADPESRGRIVAAVLGGAGADGLGLVGLGGPDTFEGLVDGGLGRDIARVTRNVVVRNCEEVEFID